ncbi:hypothetical protein SSAG_02495 [Streptomyces sp. Mg1]|nr:hypothetical protein SSAG_02495 [Streptomyces sp. Mg1]
MLPSYCLGGPSGMAGNSTYECDSRVPQAHEVQVTLMHHAHVFGRGQGR